MSKSLPIKLNKVPKKDLPGKNHSDFLDEVTLKSMEAFDLITAKMIEEITRHLKAEKLAKSEKDYLKDIVQQIGMGSQRGFTGAVPRMEIKLDFIGEIVDKYNQALKWVLMGKAAGKDVEKLVEDLGLKTKVPAGTVFGTFLHSVDEQRDYFNKLTTLPPPKLDNKALKYTFDFINQRSGKWVDESLLKYKNKVIQAIEDQVNKFNQTNISNTSQEYHRLLAEKAKLLGEKAAIEYKRELVREAVNNVVEKKMSLLEAKQFLKETTQTYNKDWNRLVNTEFGMASSAGNHMAIQEMFGAADDEMRVVNVNIQDLRCCDECEEWSRNPDGSLKIHKLSEIEPVGYNIGKKRNNWKLTAGTHHPHCLPKDTLILTKQNGWKLIQEIDHSDLIFSEDLETGLGEWVEVDEIIKFHQKKLISFSNKWNKISVAKNHSHVVYSRKAKTKMLVKNEDLGISHSFCLTLSDWHGQDPEFINIGSYKFKAESFAKFMGCFLAEGSVSTLATGKVDIKISQSKYLDLFNSVCEEMFSSYFSVYKGKDAVYIRLDKCDDFYQFISQFGYSFEKYVPNEIKKMSKNNIVLFLHYFSLGDGTTRNGRGLGKFSEMNFSNSISYFTSSKKLMSDLCELLLKVGKSISVTSLEPSTVVHRNGTYTGNHTIYRIQQKNSKVFTQRKSTKEEIEYNDFVYGVSLKKNYNMFVMQEGKVFQTGNCRCRIVYVPKGFTVDKDGSLVKET